IRPDSEKQATGNRQRATGNSGGQGLHLELGYSSLFALLTERLGLSNASAYFRAGSAHLIDDLPRAASLPGARGRANSRARTSRAQDSPGRPAPASSTARRRLWAAPTSPTPRFTRPSSCTVVRRGG